MSPGKNDSRIYSVLHTLVASDGVNSEANLIFDGFGNLYGTTTAFQRRLLSRHRVRTHPVMLGGASQVRGLPK
jgi:hypothetical protein